MLVFGRPEHLKNLTKILANTFSDSLAILKLWKKLPGDAGIFFLWEDSRFPSHSHNSIHNPHGFPSCSLPIPSYNSWREVTPMGKNELDGGVGSKPFLSKKIPARAGWPRRLALVRASPRGEVDVIGVQRCKIANLSLSGTFFHQKNTLVK